MAADGLPGPNDVRCQVEVCLFREHRIKLVCPVHGWLVTLPEGPHEATVLARVSCPELMRKGYAAITCAAGANQENRNEQCTEPTESV